MERKEFIEKVGLSGAAILIFGCMQSCSKDDNVNTTPMGNNYNTGGGSSTTTKIDFTINLATTPYDVLQKEGGYFVNSANNIIIARTTGSELIAVSSICTHQGATIEYKGSTNRFYCALHGSNFNQNGSVVNGPATQSLKQYKTTLTGNSLRVYE